MSDHQVGAPRLSGTASATPGERSDRNWFEQGGEGYARYRPAYPAELARLLATAAPGRRLAVDVGCGSGQFTAQLAAHVDEVVGVDPSADQLAHAPDLPGVRFVQAPAEELPLPDGCADLVTVAQAVHWFDLPAFYAEVRRVTVPGAVLALISYGILHLDPDLQPRFLRFYAEDLGAFWPPERALVEAGYRTLDFPFEEREAPDLAIEVQWSLADLLGYVSTWSAVRRARDAGREGMLASFATDLAPLWGDPETRRTARFPLAVRWGTT